MLYDESGLFGTHNELFDDFTREDTLFGVKIGGRLIDKEDIGRHSEDQADSYSL